MFGSKDTSRYFHSQMKKYNLVFNKSFYRHEKILNAAEPSNLNKLIYQIRKCS